MKALPIILFALLALAKSHGQLADRPNVKFGKIALTDFNTPTAPFLEGADAVYLYDVGKTEFNGNSKGWFTLEFERHVRIKILTTQGFDAAEFELPLYKDGSDVEKVLNLKALTFNVENGAITQMKLKDEDIFEDKQSKKFTLKKFTMPGVKVGSIIDVQYTISSDFFTNLQPWPFQGRYPRLWSEYEVFIPEFFNFVFLAQGYLNYHVNSTGESFKSYNIVQSQGASASEFVRIDARVNTHRWVIKDVPSLKKEPFTTTLSNHVSKIDFQLNRIQFGTNPPRNYMSNWPMVVTELNNNPRFGSFLYKGNNWLDDDLKPVLGGSTNPAEKAQKIFNFVRDNFTCTERGGTRMSVENGLKSILKARKGTGPDINLLLVAMLQHEGIEAYPVMLSTRDHGFSNELYPLLDRFNMVIATAQIDGKTLYLDATDPNLGFNKLNADCYNGHARIINGLGMPVYLDADSVYEKKVTTVFISNNEKGQWEGTLSSTLGYFESLALRETLKAKGKDEQIKRMQNALNEVKIGTPEFSQLENKDQSVTVNYGLTIEHNGEDIIYFSPMLAEGYKENPFKSADRFYPVEMDYATDETYVLNIEIPEGYVLDDKPKSARVNLNDADGSYEYMIGVQENRVMLRSRLVIKRANFEPDDYQTLRDFFGYVVKKQSEQIVFKKVQK
ncbi:MAG: DUF3857 domain-containing protein [Bacteroidetes bacterium]|nr:MAG: DUF3857 domain-containing protein [Bacteroidota bacterium]